MRSLASNQPISYSFHSTVRADQRGISRSSIEILANEGQVIYKQGLRFFFMTEKDLKFFDCDLAAQLKNLVVVLAGDSNYVITSYKNPKAIKSIKRKSKRLIACA